MSKKGVYPYMLMFLSIPLAWEAAVRISGAPTFLLPPPRMVAEVLWEERLRFLAHGSITVAEAMTGYLIANVIAIVLAVLFLYIPPLETFVVPWTVLITKIPFIAIASILIILLGGDSLVPKVIIVVLVTFYPVLTNLNTGLRAAEAVLLDRMRTLHASRWQIFRHVRWPASLPFYMAAHKIAFPSCIIGAIIGEWLFAWRGLGYLLDVALTDYRADRLWATTAISLFLALAALLLVNSVEVVAFRWKGK